MSRVGVFYFRQAPKRLGSDSFVLCVCGGGWEGGEGYQC